MVIVNQLFARRFWPNENAIGKTIVVGVAQDVRNRGIAEDPQPQVWLPFAQLPWGDMNLLVRTAVPPLDLATAVRAQVFALDPDQPVTGVQSVDELMDSGRAQPRFTMMLLTVFSAVALLLAAIGLAAMLAWSVVQRRQEMAIRLALGASQNDILWLVVRQGMLLALTGIAIGLTAGFLLTHFLSSVLYRTSVRDLGTFALAPLVFLLIAWLASWVPAQRATRIDPIDSMRAG